MHSRLLALAILALPAAAVPQATAPPGRSMTQLVGRYELADKEMKASVDLRADGSFTYHIGALDPLARREGGDPALWEGRWRTRSANKIVLENAPGSLPRLVRTGAVRDPSVRVAVTVVGPPERVVQEVGLAVIPRDESESAGLSDGRWARPLVAATGDEGRGPRRATRLPTRLELLYSVENPVAEPLLAAVDLQPGGPNRFTFAYTPSSVPPFYLRGIVRDLDAGLIEVEAGQAGLPMRRVGPARPAS